jgi:hypothetical protein
VYTPAAHADGAVSAVMCAVLERRGCGAESEPRKNLGLPDEMAERRAARSRGSLATGLQKWKGWPATSSIVSERWCAVMVQATLAGREATWG